MGVEVEAFAQARERWGEQAAAAMWDAVTIRLILGGSAQPKDLQDHSGVCGDRNEELRNWSHGPDGGRSWPTSARRMLSVRCPSAPASYLRGLPRGSLLADQRLEASHPSRSRLPGCLAQYVVAQAAACALYGQAQACG
ncbi:hypothetical protein BWI15_12190 [Kribbella sp. ALI-6-A]|uniref:TraM recognition domain-containing protein n=1 Tax=Kribbella sp. ALI-6-A TaxID=1933817 RepID=UPI00097C125A|nr:hypothetical protein BWI15_12190 [Kribbella sp. ALI-6-A]